MSALRILDTGLAPACWNVAMTAALVELHGRDAIGDTVRFHRYRACVLIGAGQDLPSAADLEYCRRAGIAIVRRVTGGGAVYMSPAMLAWDVVVDRAAAGGSLDAVTARVCGGVAAGLSRLGAKAGFRPPNDIAIGGRKVSGAAGYAAGRSAVLQGTVLIADEAIAMARALGLPEPALRERTICLAAEIGAAPVLHRVIEAISQGLAEALDCRPVPSSLHQEEVDLCEALMRAGIGADADATAGAAPEVASFRESPTLRASSGRR
jgi:lipoate-protein ligase A